MESTNNKESYIVSLQSVSIFGSGEPLLEKIDFKLVKNDFVFLLGKTGQGKTSFLKTLYGEMALKVGVGKVFGFNLAHLNSHNLPLLRRNLGIVFQDFQLLNDRTIFENLHFVLQVTGWENEGQIIAKINEVATNVGMENKLSKMPFQISAGEQKLIDIARAMLNSPKLIIADEPTANLDAETSEKIMNLLFSISQEKETAVIISTHDLQFISKYPAKKYEIFDKKLHPLN
ncbi:MAG: ATP-binding cassette domain-containing protein [Sediminibacterium sp.]|nr:ATP-binding cassette domain-containing protein [Sediminibacterium sp.]